MNMKNAKTAQKKMKSKNSIAVLIPFIKNRTLLSHCLSSLRATSNAFIHVCCDEPGRPKDVMNICKKYDANLIYNCRRWIESDPLCWSNIDPSVRQDNTSNREKKQGWRREKRSPHGGGVGPNFAVLLSLPDLPRPRLAASGPGSVACLACCAFLSVAPTFRRTAALCPGIPEFWFSPCRSAGSCEPGSSIHSP